MNGRRILTLTLAVLTFGMALLHIVWAQTYPARTITMIAPAAAGGSTDVIARIVGAHMSRMLGQRLIIENVPGAGGTVRPVRTMRANPDGYTIQIDHTSTHPASVRLYPNLA